MRRAAALIIVTLALAAISAAVFMAARKPAPPPGPVSVPAAPLPPPTVSATAPAWAAESYRAARQAMPEASDEVSLFAVGDLMPGRGVDRAKARHEAGWLLADVAAAVRAADISIANLEAPIAAGAVIPDDAMRLRADPGVEKEIAAAGFDLLSLANNHALDAGLTGLRSTRQKIEAQGMLEVGSGENEAEARRGRTIERNGLKITFFAYVDPSFTRAGDRALPDRPGLAFMDAATVADDLASAASSDVTVVIMHAGLEYAEEPTETQKGFAHAAIDAGADLVIGHHPHVVQTAELYKGKPILYSLGNFVFDQGWSNDASRGLAVDIRLGKEGVRRIIWRPLAVAASGQPSFGEGDTVGSVLSRVGALAEATPAFVPRGEDLMGGGEAFRSTLAPAPSGNLATVREADLDGDGKAERLSLAQGRLTLERGGAEIWSSPEDWWIDDFAAADLTRDGKPDLAFSVWKPGDYGSSKPDWVTEEDLDVKDHFFVYALEDGELAPVWQSSNLDAPNCAFEAFDVDGDGKQELVAAEGAYGDRPDCRATDLAVWRWGGWGFSNVWRQSLGALGGFDAVAGPHGGLIPR